VGYRNTLWIIDIKVEVVIIGHYANVNVGWADSFLCPPLAGKIAGQG